MATSLDYIQYVVEKVSACGSVRYQKMFGEYMVYINDKPLLLVCDNSVYVKQHPSITDLMKQASQGYPYPGAKLHWLLDIDQEDITKQVIAVLEPITSLPKKKAKKVPSKSKRSGR